MCAIPTTPSFPGSPIPRKLSLTAPRISTVSALSLTKVEFNQPVGEDKFLLEQPPGTELINLDRQSPPRRRKKAKLVNKLIIANLVIRPVRTLVSITAVGMEVVLILMVVGLTHGILEETAKRTQGVGADIMVQPQTTSALMAFSGAPMPIQIRDRLAQVAAGEGGGSGHDAGEIPAPASP